MFGTKDIPGMRLYSIQLFFTNVIDFFMIPWAIFENSLEKKTMCTITIESISSVWLYNCVVVYLVAEQCHLSCNLPEGRCNKIEREF